MQLEKLKTQQEIKNIAERLNNEGQIIVTTNGSFDLIHAGHIRTLKEAKSQGDVLIVGLNSDKSVKAYKSPDRPIIPEYQRAEILDAIKYVDYIVLFDQPEIAVPLIKLVRPKIHCNGAEYGENCVETPIIKEVGAKLHLIKETQDEKGKISTTKIIKKIREMKI